MRPTCHLLDWRKITAPLRSSGTVGRYCLTWWKPPIGHRRSLARSTPRSPPRTPVPLRLEADVVARPGTLVPSCPNGSDPSPVNSAPQRRCAWHPRPTDVCATHTRGAVGGHEPVKHALHGRRRTRPTRPPHGCCPGRIEGPPIPAESEETSSKRVTRSAEGGALAGPLRAGRTPARDSLRDSGRNPVLPMATSEAAPVDAPQPAVGVEGYRERLAAPTKPTRGDPVQES